MEPMLVTQSDTDAGTVLQIADDGSRLSFFRSDDRLSHTLTHAGCVLLQSVDATPELSAESWPVSPVFQEVHEEQLAQGLSLMTVGQWGKIHFSAVFLAKSQGVLSCEIAARVRASEPAQLASTYTLLRSASDLISADPGEIVCRLDADRRLIIRADATTQLALVPAGLTALRVQAGPRTSDAGATRAGSVSRTIQWGYTLELVS